MKFWESLGFISTILISWFSNSWSSHVNLLCGVLSTTIWYGLLLIISSIIAMVAVLGSIEVWFRHCLKFLCFHYQNFRFLKKVMFVLFGLTDFLLLYFWISFTCFSKYSNTSKLILYMTDSVSWTGADGVSKL